MKTSDTAAVVRSTARLIESARAVIPSYAEGFGGAVGQAPTPTWCMASLLKGCRTSIEEFRFDSDAKGMAFSFGDEHVIAIDSACKRSDAMFTIRHELGHVLADEVQHALFLTSEDTMSFSERRADLFAIADLTPTRWMDWVKGKRRPWRAVTLDVVQAFRELTEGWSEQRIWDRAKLRVMLYRLHGI